MMPPLSPRSSKQHPYSTFRRWWSAPAAAALVVALAVLSACAAGGSSNANTGKINKPTATATIQPSATPKPKPTSVPTTSVAYCQGLLSLADVNHIMKPAAPATNILFYNDSSDHDSECGWAAGHVIAVFAVGFLPFPAGASLNSVAQKLAESNTQPGAKISIMPVSDLGDQALYASVTLPTPIGLNYAADLYVAYGGVLLGCSQTGTGAVPVSLAPKLVEACLVVMSNL